MDKADQEYNFEINYSRLKLKRVQEILMDKSIESIQLMFETFVKEHLCDDAAIVNKKMIFYCILKT